MCEVTSVKRKKQLEEERKKEEDLPVGNCIEDTNSMLRTLEDDEEDVDDPLVYHS